MCPLKTLLLLRIEIWIWHFYAPLHRKLQRWPKKNKESSSFSNDFKVDEAIEWQVYLFLDKWERPPFRKLGLFANSYSQSLANPAAPFCTTYSMTICIRIGSLPINIQISKADRKKFKNLQKELHASHPYCVLEKKNRPFIWSWVMIEVVSVNFKGPFPLSTFQFFWR